MTATPARDYLLPRLNALLADAAAHGFERDVAVAVVIDIVTGPGFNDTALDPRADDPPTHPDNAPLTVTEVAVPSAEASNPRLSEYVTRRFHRT